MGLSFELFLSKLNITQLKATLKQLDLELDVEATSFSGTSKPAREHMHSLDQSDYDNLISLT